MDAGASVSAAGNGFLTAAFTTAATFAISHTLFAVAGPVFAPAMYNDYIEFTKNIADVVTGGESASGAASAAATTLDQALS